MSQIIRRALKILESRMSYHSVHVREIVKLGLKLNAASVICAHNHPSGVCEPSHADETITKRIKEACAVMEIRVLDHLIVSGTDAVSLAERGLI